MVKRCYILTLFTCLSMGFKCLMSLLNLKLYASYIHGELQFYYKAVRYLYTFDLKTFFPKHAIVVDANTCVVHKHYCRNNMDRQIKN